MLASQKMHTHLLQSPRQQPVRLPSEYLSAAYTHRTVCIKECSQHHTLNRNIIYKYMTTGRAWCPVPRGDSGRTKGCSRECMAFDQSKGPMH